MSDTPIRQTREGTGLPVLPSRMALIELCVLVAAIVLERFVEPFPDLTRMNPHPYWIFVLLLSLQYGTVSGLLAAVVAIIGSIVIGLPEADVGESYFEYLVRVWTQPVLWLITALMLGSFRMRQIEFRDDLIREVDDLQARGVALVDHVKNLRARCDALERELAASSEPEAHRVLDAVAQLAKLPLADGEASFRAAMGLAFPNAQASVFTARIDGWSLAYSSGWSERSRWLRDFNGNEPFVQAVCGDCRPLSILSAKDEPLLAGQGQFAVPIISQSTRRAVGFLKIESLPAQSIGPGTIDRLSLIARQLAICIGQTEQAATQVAPVPSVKDGTKTQQGLAAAIRLLPRLRWRTSQPPQEGAQSASHGDVAAVGDEAPRSLLRRT